MEIFGARSALSIGRQWIESWRSYFPNPLALYWLAHCGALRYCVVHTKCLQDNSPQEASVPKKQGNDGTKHKNNFHLRLVFERLSIFSWASYSHHFLGSLNHLCIVFGIPLHKIRYFFKSISLVSNVDNIFFYFQRITHQKSFIEIGGFFCFSFCAHCWPAIFCCTFVGTSPVHFKTSNCLLRVLQTKRRMRNVDKRMWHVTGDLT